MPDRFVIGRGFESEGKKNDSTRGSYNTMRPDPATRPTRTFRSRITVFFALAAVMTAVLLSAVLAYVWEGQFQGYTRQNMQRTAQAAADTLGAQYQTGGGWTDEVIAYADTFATGNPEIGLQILNSQGEIIYDREPSTVRRGTDSTYDQDAVAIVSAEIHNTVGTKLGTVRMWSTSASSLLTEDDAAFRESSYRAILWAALIAIVIASVMGYFTSRSLVRPINRITSTAGQIRNGDLTARTGLSGDDEIGRLGETFDEMATTIERDIKHERRLTGDVAHELRTPLMAIQVTVEAMQDGVLPADDEHLQTVDDEVRRLSRLVDAMLHLSRLENGKSAFNPQRTDVVYLVRSLVDMQGRLFEAKGLRLRFDDKTLHNELYADVDPDGVQEAVTNLLSNAMRYTSEGGWVVVTVEQDRNDVLISVRDTGMGIAKEDIPRTFSRFWRSDASRERAAGGLGVGLAITKGIVDQHNGTISVESELGKGTTFTLRLPIDQQRHGRRREVEGEPAGPE